MIKTFLAWFACILPLLVSGHDGVPGVELALPSHYICTQVGDGTMWGQEDDLAKVPQRAWHDHLFVCEGLDQGVFALFQLAAKEPDELLHFDEERCKQELLRFGHCDAHVEVTLWGPYPVIVIEFTSGHRRVAQALVHTPDATYEIDYLYPEDEAAGYEVWHHFLTATRSSSHP